LFLIKEADSDKDFKRSRGEREKEKEKSPVLDRSGIILIETFAIQYSITKEYKLQNITI
jgi:hypothetical protein